MMGPLGILSAHDEPAGPTDDCAPLERRPIVGRSTAPVVSSDIASVASPISVFCQHRTCIPRSFEHGGRTVSLEPDPSFRGVTPISMGGQANG